MAGLCNGRERPYGRGWALLNVKASSMLCLLDRSEPRKFKSISLRQCQKWLLRVCNNCIPGCVARVHQSSCTLFPGGTYKYRRGQTLDSSLMGAFLGPRLEDEWRWKPTFCVYCSLLYFQYAMLKGFRGMNEILYGYM